MAMSMQVPSNKATFMLVSFLAVRSESIVSDEVPVVLGSRIFATEAKALIP